MFVRMCVAEVYELYGEYTFPPVVGARKRVRGILLETGNANSILTGKGQVTIPAGLRVVIQNCVLCSKTIGNQTEYPGITTILNHYPSPKR